MEERVSFDSPSVQSYLTILQTVIGHMATNSASCKTWCVTLVSAIIVIIAGQGKPNYVWISVVPIALFMLLDAYYLSLERQFRSVYNDLVRKLRFGKATIDDVFFWHQDQALLPHLSTFSGPLGPLQCGCFTRYWR